MTWHTTSAKGFGTVEAVAVPRRGGLWAGAISGAVAGSDTPHHCHKILTRVVGGDPEQQWPPGLGALCVWWVGAARPWETHRIGLSTHETLWPSMEGHLVIAGACTAPRCTPL